MTADAPTPRDIALLALLRERHDFPEYPHPAEGEVTDAELAEEQEKWRVRFDDLDRRVQEVLSEPLPLDQEATADRATPKEHDHVHEVHERFQEDGH